MGMCGCPAWADIETSDIVLGRKEDFGVCTQELKDRRKEARRKVKKGEVQGSTWVAGDRPAGGVGD